MARGENSLAYRRDEDHESEDDGTSTPTKLAPYLALGKYN